MSVHTRHEYKPYDYLFTVNPGQLTIAITSGNVKIIKNFLNKIVNECLLTILKIYL